MTVTSKSEIKREMEINLFRSQNAQLRADLDYALLCLGEDIVKEEVEHVEIG